VKSFPFNIRPEAPAGVRQSVPAVFPLKVAWASTVTMARKRTLKNVASVYKKLERLKRLAGFLG
jgi:hypothetical protein